MGLVLSHKKSTSGEAKLLPPDPFGLRRLRKSLSQSLAPFLFMSHTLVAQHIWKHP